MSLTDDELQQLEEYLDDALASSDAEALRDRVARDAAWAAALDRLRAERSMREKLFAALEPEEASADRMASRFINAARGAGSAARYRRVLKLTSAAAACLAMGLVGGWLLRDRSLAMNHLPAGGSVATVAGGHHEAKVAEVVAYQVELTDEAGRVTAVQKFDSLEKAREFADDLSRWQERQRQMRNGAAVVVADKF